jgi:hypothetical protein
MQVWGILTNYPYITDDVAFQAMALSKESMSGHWFTQCTMQMQCTLTEVQLSEVKLWTNEEYCMLGDKAERRGKGETKLGVKATATAAYANANADDTNTKTDEINLRTLDEFQNREFVEKISKARKMLTDQKLKLKTMRTSKVKDQQSIETKIFKMLKEIGVELSSYHGGSLNGKDIRKVMTNACYILIHSLQFLRRGRGQTAFWQTPTSMPYACSFARYLFCGTGHFH